MKEILKKYRATTAMAIVAVSLSACFAPADNSAQSSTQAVEQEKQEVKAERYVNTPNIGVLIRRYLSPEGYMDQAFPPTVAYAKEYLYDFYGAQAIADVSREQIISDFTPKYADVTASDEHSVTLTFKDGTTAQFFPNSTLNAMNFQVERSHFVVEAERWTDSRANIKKILGIIDEMGKTSEYLIKNPFYAEEKIVEDHFKKSEHAKVTVTEDFDLVNKSENSLYIVQESVHGIRKDADKLLEAIRKGDFAFLGMEMLNTTEQPILDRYNSAEIGTPEFNQARQDLIDYFAEAWNGRGGQPKTSGEENYYFEVCEAAKKAGIDIYGIEQATVEYIFFGYGETLFGGAMRSYQWSENVPKTGRGLMFGGGAHFKTEQPISVQDFMATFNPEREIFSISDLTHKNRQK